MRLCDIYTFTLDVLPGSASTYSSNRNVVVRIARSKNHVCHIAHRPVPLFGSGSMCESSCCIWPDGAETCVASALSQPALRPLCRNLFSVRFVATCIAPALSLPALCPLCRDLLFVRFVATCVYPALSKPAMRPPCAKLRALRCSICHKTRFARFVKTCDASALCDIACNSEYRPILI